MAIEELLTFDTEDTSELLVKAGLPDISFAESNPDKIMANLVQIFNALGGHALAPADPTYLTFKVITYALTGIRRRVDFAGKQNLLAYSRAWGLDHLGLLIGTARTAAKSAQTTMLITLSEKRTSAVVIPAGTRVTAGDNVYFNFDKDITINPGQLTATAIAYCMTAGKLGNGYMAGQINKLVDPVPWVASVVNTDASAAGSDVETDEPYRERIHLAPERFSSAGPKGAYEYFALSANTGIIDTYVEGPEDRNFEREGEVDLYVLMEDGELPEQEVLDQVKVACSNKTVRPCTDKVNVRQPKKKMFNFSATYYIAKSKETTQGAIQLAVNQAVEDYIVWQRSKMGRDIEPSELIHRIMEAGAKRVEPAFVHQAVANNEIAWNSSKNIIYGGLEDD